MSPPEPRELDCELVQTSQGAAAIRDRATGEVMHPVVGPAIEATALYVEPSRLAARLAEPDEQPLVLLDVGLGGGSNAIAAWRVSAALPVTARRLAIVSFDHSLGALALAVEHAAQFGFEGDAGIAARALLTDHHHETARTSWSFLAGELPATLAEAPLADVVFWDPFSPKANPSLWSVAAFTALRRVCRAGATVHTYSGATATRSALLLAGFAVGVGPSTNAGKFGTLAATDLETLAAPLDRRWLERLSRSSAAFPPDAPEDALARVAALPQFAPA